MQKQIEKRRAHAGCFIKQYFVIIVIPELSLCHKTEMLLTILSQHQHQAMLLTPQVSVSAY